MTPHRTLRLLLLALAIAPCATSAPRGDEATARTLILERFTAALRNDVAALELMLADDLEYCTTRGTCQTKQEYIGRLKSGAMQYQSIEPVIERVKLFADTAVATGRAAVSAKRDGQVGSVRFSWLAVLAWRDDRWVLTTWSATPLEAAP
jgi:hypothetical protein